MNTKTLTYLAASFFVGLALAVLFGILAAVDEGNRGAYVAALIASLLAGLAGGIGYLSKR